MTGPGMQPTVHGLRALLHVLPAVAAGRIVIWSQVDENEWPYDWNTVEFQCIKEACVENRMDVMHNWIESNVADYNNLIIIVDDSATCNVFVMEPIDPGDAREVRIP